MGKRFPSLLFSFSLSIERNTQKNRFLKLAKRVSQKDLFTTGFQLCRRLKTASNFDKTSSNTLYFKSHFIRTPRLCQRIMNIIRTHQASDEILKEKNIGFLNVFSDFSKPNRFNQQINRPSVKNVVQNS